MKNIVFIAPPAAGKGTQAEIISKKYNIPHISLGDILRDIAKENSEIGQYVSETISSGNLVKDEITYKLLEDRLSKDDCKDGFILDGFPRNIEQALEYDEILERLKLDLGYIIYINVPRDVLEKRITGRRICEDCNAIYNINEEDQKPEMESVCDKCGGHIYQRKDDNLESFNTRFDNYETKTEPIIKHYKDLNALQEVDGVGTLDEVTERIEKVLDDNN